MLVLAPLTSWRRLIFAGMLIRFLFSFWTGNPSDFEIFLRVGYHVAQGGSPTQAKIPYVEGLGQPFYRYVSGIGYLPAWGLCTALAYKTYQLLPFSPYFYYFLLKSFPILGDLAATYLIFFIVKGLTHDVKRAEEAGLRFFMCPFVIFISSIWGMFDSIPISLTLLSILLLFLGKPYWSALALGLGIYFKVVPIIYLPIQLILIGKSKGAKYSIVYLLISIATPLVLTIVPMILLRWEVSETGITVLSQTAMMGEGITYWNLSSFLRELAPNIFSEELLNLFFSFPIIRYLWLLALIACYVFYLKDQVPSSKNMDAYSLYALSKWSSIAMIGFLLTRTFIPEQFTLYLLFTMTVMLGISRNASLKRFYFYAWVFALAFAFVNLYPFAFAYLLDINLWYAFYHLATMPPFSTLRNAGRFVLAVFFDYSLLRTLINMVKEG